jgi:hypothetical protein
MKSKLALVLALAAVLAVPVAYAKEKDPSSAPPGQVKKEEGQQPPGQAQHENADADDASAQQEPAAQAEEQPAADDTSAEPPGQAKKQQAAAPPGQAKKNSAASVQAKKQSSHVPSGQAKKGSTHVPPGQAKKESGNAAPVVHAQNNGDHGAPKGKITICHATHSATNPYVEITISVNGMHGHGGHDDIVPAPAGGCPSGARVQENTPPAHEPAHPEKITICHATHSATNPYVEITISVNGLNGHDHHDDIVPAPAGGCPAPQAGTSIAGGPTASVSAGGAGSGAASVEAASASTEGIAASETTPTSGVAGVQAFGVGQPLPAAKKSGGVLGTVTRAKLPFTGLPLLPFVLGGLLAIVLGTALVRRRATRTL